MDDEGLQVDQLPDNAKLVFVSPSHQLPLGVRMSLPRRQALLAWADRVGSVVIEDDYDSEFRFTGRPIEPLHTLDRSGRVVYIGMPGEPIRYDVVAAQVKEARVEHVFRYAHVYPRALALMSAGKIDVKPLITDTFGFADSVKAFDFATNMPPTSVKAQIVLA